MGVQLSRCEKKRWQEIKGERKATISEKGNKAQREVCYKENGREERRKVKRKAYDKDR